MKAAGDGGKRRIRSKEKLKEDQKQDRGMVRGEREAGMGGGGRERE